MQADVEPAFVIHRRPYRETSLIVELMTRDFGRIGVIAKGAKRPRSPLRGVLQPFNLLSVSFRGRGELLTLTQAETEHAAPPLQGGALVSGLYLNELIYRLCGRSDPQPGVFLSYARTVEALQENSSIEPALRLFEKRLLDSLGYGLVLDHEADSERPVDARLDYFYVPEQGPIPAGTRSHGGAPSYLGSTLLALAHEEELSAVQLREAKRLMRAILAHHLGDRPLATREMFASLPKANPLPSVATNQARPKNK